MLKRIVAHWRTALLLLALWLWFESTISWFAFCEEATIYAGPYQPTPKDGCFLGGPLASIIAAFLRLWQSIFHHADAYVALFTAILVVSTTALWWSTRQLWQATVDADKARARDTEILQRAYLSVDPGGVLPFESVGNVAHSVAHISVRNVGHMPARHVAWFINYEMSPNGQRSDFPIDTAYFYGNNTIPPGTEMRRSQNCVFTVEEIAAFKGNSLFLYVWGEIHYSDGFGQSRFTSFCHRYDQRGLGTPTQGEYTGRKDIMLTAESMRYHQHGNEAD